MAIRRSSRVGISVVRSTCVRPPPGAARPHRRHPVAHRRFPDRARRDAGVVLAQHATPAVEAPMTRSTRMLLGARASALALAVAWAVSPAGAQTFPGGAQATPSYDP